jgi:hypothetical protein
VGQDAPEDVTAGHDDEQGAELTRRSSSAFHRFLGVAGKCELLVLRDTPDRQRRAAHYFARAAHIIERPDPLPFEAECLFFVHVRYLLGPS